MHRSVANGGELSVLRFSNADIETGNCSTSGFNP